MRWAVFLLFLIPFAMACISPGYSCDRGAVEVHVPVNMNAAERALIMANARPVGQSWGMEGSVRVFYGSEYPILLYIWPEGVRVQIAVKAFDRRDPEENCVFYVEPKDLNIKEIVENELAYLSKKGVVALDRDTAERIVRLAGWGVAGNVWIEANGGVRIEGVRGCRFFPVFILDRWNPQERRSWDVGGVYTAIAFALLLVLVWIARR